MRDGFTLLEIVIILVVLSVLVAVGVPKIASFREEAVAAVEAQNVAMIRIGINRYYIDSILSSRSPLYAETLDGAAIGSFSSWENPFFTAILHAPGLVQGGWTKLNDVRYRAPGGDVYSYDPVNGSFTE
ncbi:MAG: hypothetical protein ABH858_05190 [Candidatus Omnitrophota bacterium]